MCSFIHPLMPKQSVQPIGSFPKLSGHCDPSRYRRTVMGPSIRHDPVQSRDAVGAWSPRSSSVHGQLRCDSVSRSQNWMQRRRSGSGCSTFVTETMNDVFIILFDTLVVVATLYNTLGLMRRSRELRMLPRKSLTQILVEQGLIRYGFVLSITLASGIAAKVLRPSISTILLDVQDSLSVIVICRCHLALQERVAHPNGTTHSAHYPVTSFRAATRHIHNSLMEEFSDPSVSEIGTSEPHGKDGPSSTAVVGIELEEIHHGRELGSAVDDSSIEVCAELQTAASTGQVSIEV
ncbi:hypothetical protein JB92DRAFT_1588614 [Gautieria morchelliformis]|nr:hypothetical protein JB92DRAFT_1588614 [Gautieria morchelliformis]